VNKALTLHSTNNQTKNLFSFMEELI